MRRLISIVLVILSIVPQCFALPTTSASAAIVVDATSGRVLYEQNSHTSLPIASITKLLTALVVVNEVENLDEVVTVTLADTQTEGSSMYLKVGEEVTVEALLYGLLLSSGNDAALALARYTAGDVATFVDWMNGYAKGLHMTESHFANPNGLNDEAHYASAYDMSLVAVACLEELTIANIVATQTITIGDRYLTNHNKMLTLYEGCIGMKTGYTERSGRTLVTAAKRNGQQLVCVTLQDRDDWIDHANLLDYGFATYPLTQLGAIGETVTTVPVTGSLVPMVAVKLAESVRYPLQPGETVTAELTLPSTCVAPVVAGETLGQMTYYLGDTKVATVDVVASQSIYRNQHTASSLWQWFTNRGGA